MKKNYFMLAATTMMFAACAQTDVVNEIATEAAPQAISFDAFAGKATRAEITNADDLQTVGFSVWGYKYPRSANDIVWVDEFDQETQTTTKANYFTVFDGVDVTYNTDWGYTDKQYWDRTSTYNFYAAAPAEPAGVTYGINKGMITISGAASAKSTESHDFLIDRDGRINVDGNYAGTDHAAVDLDFHHIMSKLSFKLKAAVAENITVTKLTMTGWDNGKGDFTQILKAKPSVANYTSEWNIPTTEAGSINLVGTGATQASISLNSDMTTVSNVTDVYIMVPQIIAPNALTFTIDFGIEGETFTAQVGKLSTQQVWGTDTHTTYTISVGPDVIDFNVVNVCNWDAGAPDSSFEIE